MLGIDFLPFVFIVVYVGAIAVLFLFVVIILDIKLGSSPKDLKQIPMVIFLSLSLFIILNSIVNPYASLNNLDARNFYEVDDNSSLNTLGQVLYTEYMLHFVIAGLVLLVAIIGAIVLTSRRRQISLKQKVFKQVERHKSIGRNKNLYK
jgi:NADH-quinone oxidoreductase subunit J